MSEDNMKSIILKKAKNVSSKFKNSFKSKSKRRNDVGVCNNEDFHELEEQNVLESFRQALIMDNFLPTRFDDYLVMLRFLKARKYNIEKAKVMWENMLQWRKSFGTDTILEKICKWLVQLLMGLDYLHTNYILHREVKVISLPLDSHQKKIYGAENRTYKCECWLEDLRDYFSSKRLLGKGNFQPKS